MYEISIAGGNQQTIILEHYQHDRIFSFNRPKQKRISYVKMKYKEKYRAACFLQSLLEW